MISFTAASKHASRQRLQRLYHEISFASHGEPRDVLEHRVGGYSKQSNDDEKIADNFVEIKMLHVPWNPADVNTVQGKYPVDAVAASLSKSLHFDGCTVAGSEGWGRVVSQSKLFPKDSLVSIGSPGSGTLRSTLLLPEDSLLKVPDEIKARLGPAGCSLFQLGGTAYRMLCDFVALEPGEVVLQNCGNSGVGYMASQIAASLFGCPLVSLIRRGQKSNEEFEALVQFLKQDAKNAHVVSEEELQNPDSLKAFQGRLRELSGNGRLPRLAFNAVGGPSASVLLKSLDTGGYMVTYGGMAMQPVSVAIPQLIFKDVHVVGYWHSRWMRQHSQGDRQNMIDILCKAVLEQELKTPEARIFPLSEVKEALDWQAKQGAVRKKLVFKV